jgi:1-deoxy-D-xylulose-5-phosphate reductoisomerase
MSKRIALLGSTGSIGTQALDVISRFPGEFEVEVLTAAAILNYLPSRHESISPMQWL